MSELVALMSRWESKMQQSASCIVVSDVGVKVQLSFRKPSLVISDHLVLRICCKGLLSRINVVCGSCQDWKGHVIWTAGGSDQD